MVTHSQMNPTCHLSSMICLEYRHGEEKRVNNPKLYNIQLYKINFCLFSVFSFENNFLPNHVICGVRKHDNM